MEPLDLTKAPPRSGNATIGRIGAPMLARTVDKLRAELPGGKLGSYQYAGFSEWTLDALGINHDELLEAVRSAKDEDAVATWIRAHTTPEKLEEVRSNFDSQVLETRLSRESFLVKYPHATLHSPQMKMLDFLDLDDAIAFARPEPAAGDSLAS